MGLCCFGPTPPSGLWNRLYFTPFPPTDVKEITPPPHVSAPSPFARWNINTWKNFHTFSYFMHFSPRYFTLTLAWLSGFDYLGWGSDAVEWQGHQRVERGVVRKLPRGRGDLTDFKTSSSLFPLVCSCAQSWLVSILLWSRAAHRLVRWVNTGRIWDHGKQWIIQRLAMQKVSLSL